MVLLAKQIVFSPSEYRHRSVCAYPDKERPGGMGGEGRGGYSYN